MAFRVAVAQPRLAELPQAAHLQQLHLPVELLRVALPVAVVAAEVVAADVAAEPLPQSSCIAQSSPFRCGSDFQDRTPFRGLILTYAQSLYPLLDPPR